MNPFKCNSPEEVHWFVRKLNWSKKLEQNRTMWAHVAEKWSLVLRVVRSNPICFTLSFLSSDLKNAKMPRDIIIMLWGYKKKRYSMFSGS